jgi:hypothetical protein
MYTIAEAARRAGVSVPILRAWERRYGIVRPQRTASGYRLYDDGAVARVRALRRLVETGWTPSAASARITAEGIPADLDGPDDAARSGAGEGSIETGRGREGRALVGTFVEAAARLDQWALAAALDEMFARGSFERVTSEVLMPALDALGEAWADGRVSVAAEHAASHAVLRRLSSAFEAAAVPARGALVLVGLPPGSHHELGALAFAVSARRAGLQVTYLGPNLPVADWVRAATTEPSSGRGAGRGRPRSADVPRAAVVGVVAADDRPAAEAVADALLRARPDLVVAFGGRSARDHPGVVLLPDDFPSAVDELASRVRARRR